MYSRFVVGLDSVRFIVMMIAVDPSMMMPFSWVNVNFDGAQTTSTCAAFSASNAG